MIIFENAGEIDPRLFSLIGVNVKESANAIGFFGTGLKVSIACLVRWGESLTIQSGLDEWRFAPKKVEICGREFSVIMMHSKYDSQQLAFTTDYGKQWQPWMVYRELWSNAQDEPDHRIYEKETAPVAVERLTRVIVAGPRIEQAHAERHSFLLDPSRRPLHIVDDLEIYEGPGERIFYRGIAVQTPDKPSLYTYNITGYLSLTEDRTVASWATDPVIARGLAQLTDSGVIDKTLAAPATKFESRLDYDYVTEPGKVWRERASELVVTQPWRALVDSEVRAQLVKLGNTLAMKPENCETMIGILEEALTLTLRGTDIKLDPSDLEQAVYMHARSDLPGDDIQMMSMGTLFGAYLALTLK